MPAVLGISGFSGSGKTTLIESLIGHFSARGLKVAVIKHIGHSIRSDSAETDTDRFFRAGATVLASSDSELFVREPVAIGSDLPLTELLGRIGNGVDLVFIEGFKRSGEFERIWLLQPGESSPPQWATGVIGVLPWQPDRFSPAVKLLERWLADKCP